MKKTFLFLMATLCLAILVSSCSTYANAKTVNCPNTQNLSGFN